MIEKNKSLFNLLVPSAVGIAVFAWAFKNFKGDEKRSMIFALVAFILSWLITRQLVSKAVEAETKPDPVIYNPNNTGGGSIGNGNSNPNFNPRPLTDALQQDIYEVWGIRNNSIYEQVAALNDIELLAVYNDYTDRYYSKDSETLIQAMNGEIYDPIFLPEPEQIIKRLTRLGAN